MRGNAGPTLRRPARFSSVQCERASPVRLPSLLSAQQRWFQARLLFFLFRCSRCVFQPVAIFSGLRRGCRYRTPLRTPSPVPRYQRVRTEIIHEGGRIIYLTFRPPPLLDDDPASLFGFNRHESSQLSANSLILADDGHWAATYTRLAGPEWRSNSLLSHWLGIRWCGPDSSS